MCILQFDLAQTVQKNRDTLLKKQKLVCWIGTLVAAAAASFSPPLTSYHITIFASQSPPSITNTHHIHINTVALTRRRRRRRRCCSHNPIARSLAAGQFAKAAVADANRIDDEIFEQRECVRRTFAAENAAAVSEGGRERKDERERERFLERKEYDNSVQMKLNERMDELRRILRKK